MFFRPKQSQNSWGLLRRKEQERSSQWHDLFLFSYPSHYLFDLVCVFRGGIPMEA